MTKWHLHPLNCISAFKSHYLQQISELAPGIQSTEQRSGFILSACVSSGLKFVTILHSGFRAIDPWSQVLDSGFHLSVFRIPKELNFRFRIPRARIRILKGCIPDSVFLKLYSGFQTGWIIDSGFLKLYSGFQKGWILDSGFLELFSKFQKSWILNYGFLELDS